MKTQHLVKVCLIMTVKIPYMGALECWIGVHMMGPSCLRVLLPDFGQPVSSDQDCYKEAIGTTFSTFRISWSTQWL